MLNFPYLRLGRLKDLKLTGDLILTRDSADAAFLISCFHDTEATTPLITLRKADGSEVAPALVDNNAVLGTIHFDGYDGSGWHTGAKIEARIDGTPSDGTDMPTELTFWTTPDASSTSVQRMVISPSGEIKINTPADVLFSRLVQINGDIYLGRANPTITFDNTNQAADNRILEFIFLNNQFIIRAVNDAGSGSNNAMIIDRTGIVIDYVTFPSGNIGVHCTQPAGTFSIGNLTEGKTASLNIQTAHETHTLTLGGTSVTTTLDIPTGALLLGAAFCVNTAVTDSAGDDTWSAAFSGGDATAIVAAIAPAQNTKAHSTIVPAVAASETQITFTPNGGNFGAGVIEIVAYYIDLTDLANV